MSEPGQELELLATGHRQIDMRSAVTDSWTDVLGDAVTLARGIAATEFVPKGLRGSVEKVTAAIMYSRELGLPPMTGLSGIHVIEGSAGLSAEVQRSLIFQAGHELQVVESSRERCVLRGRRRGSDAWTEVSWTIQEARETTYFAGKEKGWQPLATKTNWRQWPAEMLLARATSRLSRQIFPDVIHGMRSTEELADQIFEAEIVEPEPVQAPRTVKRRAKTAPAAAEVAAVEPRTAVPVPEPAEAPQGAAAVPERLRPPLPEPKTSQPEPEDGSLEADGPGDGEASPAPADTETDPEPMEVEEADRPDPPIGPRLVAVIQMHFNRLTVGDREERLFWVSQLIGRQVDSSKELTQAEGKQIASQLEKLADRAALEALQ